MAIELEKEFHHLSQSAETATTKTNDVLSTRVREIARSALKLSDRDIDDLFADSSENPEQVRCSLHVHVNKYRIDYTNE